MKNYAMIFAIISAFLVIGCGGVKETPSASAMEQVNGKLREGRIVEAVEVAKELGNKEAISRAEYVQMLYDSKQEFTKTMEIYSWERYTQDVKQESAYTFLPEKSIGALITLLGVTERLTGKLEAANPPAELQSAHADLLANIKLVKEKSVVFKAQWATLKEKGATTHELMAVQEKLKPEMKALYEIVRSNGNTFDSKLNAALKNL